MKIETEVDYTATAFFEGREPETGSFELPEEALDFREEMMQFEDYKGCELKVRVMAYKEGDEGTEWMGTMLLPFPPEF